MCYLCAILPATFRILSPSVTPPWVRQLDDGLSVNYRQLSSCKALARGGLWELREGLAVVVGYRVQHVYMHAGAVAGVAVAGFGPQSGVVQAC